jgi:hypothetical protein
LPEDFVEGDLFPSPESGDFSGTEEEARAELERRSLAAGQTAVVTSGRE